MSAAEEFAAVVERANEAGLGAEALYEWLIEADRDEALAVLRAHLRAAAVGEAVVDFWQREWGGEGE